MKKRLVIATLLAFLFSSQMIHTDAALDLSADLINASITSGQSSQESQESQTSKESLAHSGDAQSGSAALVVVVVAAGVTIVVGTVILIVHAAKVKKERMLGLQDQIYLADGKDYRDLLNFFCAR